MGKVVDSSKNLSGMATANQSNDLAIRHEDDRARVSGTRLAIDTRDLDDAILGRWLEALRRDAPNLPTPITIAMTQGVARGPLGKTLREIEQALMSIENMSIGDLTGSEVRMLAAILRQMNETVGQLSANIADQYSPTE